MRGVKLLTSVLTDVLELIGRASPMLEGSEADELEELREYIEGLRDAKTKAKTLAASGGDKQ